jgi:hypothetical protein
LTIRYVQQGNEAKATPAAGIRLKKEKSERRMTTSIFERSVKNITPDGDCTYKE